MRHRNQGRKLGRSSSHRKAMRRNMASSLFLTERDADGEDNAPKVKGRIVTTVQKAKEVRRLVEKCITIARHSLKHEEEASQFETDAERGTDAWRSWRKSEQWQKWNAAIAPCVAARRRAVQLLGDREAVDILFEDIAPRFADRDGGYTRILRLAERRVGDAGQKAILELVGVRDRVAQAPERPAFDDDNADLVTDEDAAADEPTSDGPAESPAATADDADSGAPESGATESGDEKNEKADA